jgi:hypothetical protein
MMKPIHVRLLFFFIAFTAPVAALHAADLAPVREYCTVSIGDKAGTLRLETGTEADGRDCSNRRHCHTSSNDLPVNRFSGVSLADLAQAGSHLNATLAAEAGNFTCAGAVAGNELHGDAVFTPDQAFIARMGQMGFGGLDADKLLPYALLDVRSDWARSLKEIGVQGLDADKLIPLRVFNVDTAYVRSLTALGYAMPDADQLISLRVQGVNGEEVAQIRALGYQPTLDQLVQIRIFKITPEFIRKMQARGFKDLSIDKLVQIRIFKLAD